MRRHWSCLRGASAARTTRPDRAGSVDEDRSAAVTSSRTAVRSWPLLVLAVPAAAEVWSGWVGIARLTGFGMVSPLPGIWPSLHLDTSITLPVGVEAYAAYALRAWLAGEHAVSPRTRRFAKWSAMLSFALGMAGQVTYHLLAGAGVTRAPWAITTIVSCLPVLVLAMGTTLAHMLRDDARAARTTDEHRTGHSGCWSVSWSPEDQARSGPDQEAAEGPVACWSPGGGRGIFGPGSPGRCRHLGARSPGRVIACRAGAASGRAACRCREARIAARAAQRRDQGLQ